MDNYRFGFNGMEKDNEPKGLGNSLGFDNRIMIVTGLVVEFAIRCIKNGKVRNITGFDYQIIFVTDCQ